MIIHNVIQNGDLLESPVPHIMFINTHSKKSKVAKPDPQSKQGL